MSHASHDPSSTVSTSTPALAQRLSQIAPSATTEMFRRVAEQKARGVPLISLAVGEPDFAPPPEILAAAQRALETGPYGYTQVAGLPALRTAICARSQARRAIAHTPDCVVVTAGAKHALFQLAEVLFEPGDEVLIPTPSWVSYADQVRLCGAQPVFVPCHERDGFLPTPEALAAAIGPRTKGVILCSPNNPTGAAFDATELARIAGVLRGRPLWIIVDEIYAELGYDAAAGVPSLLSVAPELREQTVIVDGVSKSYAMTGFRVGWLLGPRAVAQACEKLQSQITTSITTLAQLAALAALSGDQSCVTRMRDAYRERRDRLLLGLRALPGVSCQTPRGAFYVFPDVRAWLGRRSAERLLESDHDVAEWLLDEAQVACVPGSAFGGPGYLRLSYAVGQSDLDEALRRIGAAVNRLR
jgi:aspartate aminotransferase